MEYQKCLDALGDTSPQMPVMSDFKPQFNQHHPAQAELISWLQVYRKSNESSKRHTRTRHTRLCHRPPFHHTPFAFDRQHFILKPA